MSNNYQSIHNLKVSEELLSFINNELLKDLEISPEKFWLGFDKVIHELAPKNVELIKIRENLQKKIDKWHIENKGKNTNIIHIHYSYWYKNDYVDNVIKKLTNNLNIKIFYDSPWFWVVYLHQSKQKYKH